MPLHDKTPLPEAMQGTALVLDDTNSSTKKMYIESYGCAMNFADSEVVAAIMNKDGYATTNKMEDADLILVNTCAIRDNAEQRIHTRLREYNKHKKTNKNLKIGVMGCMAERLKETLIENQKVVDLVIGPDAYRDLPNLMNQVDDGQKAINVILSKEETYEEIEPVRLITNGVTALVSIMRGCDNMCAFCVVPFTRGRERSRNPETIVNEVKDLLNKGYKEVTLLGQNVDSYLWAGGGLKKDAIAGLKNGTITPESTVNFAQLLEMVALTSPTLRVRFSTSHPKDITDEVLLTMAKYHNICKYLHLPVQSGSSRMLELMNRGYTAEWYLQRINKMREIMPDCAVSTDVISGFCTETEEDHKATLQLIDAVGYEYAYMFTYSERPGTLAERKLADDVPEDVKLRRLQEIITLQRGNALKRNMKDVGNTYEVLVEGVSKRSEDYLYGRNTYNKNIIFKRGDIKIGDYVNVRVKECTTATLLGEVV
ncbi:MAG: tRNA (N6-isopentenyl adenosine(37)-C2)-methylthiotransferase MiaB [Bacteroidia bacterium]